MQGNHVISLKPIHMRIGCLAGLVAIAGCSKTHREPDAMSNSAPTSDATNLPLPAEEILPPAQPDLVAYPTTDQWHDASPLQRARAERSFAALKPRKVPAYGGPLFVQDDSEVRLQDAQVVARRAVILWAVALKAEATPQQEVIDLIKRADAWNSITPIEKAFLEDANPNPDLSRAMVWRLESLWVMLWALGYVDQLEWPRDMCDVPKLVEIMRAAESNPTFVTDAKLRSVAEILDAQDLTMRINWAIRDAGLHEQPRVPEDLNWTGDSAWIPIFQSPATGVVEERHYALNWLVNFQQPESWDLVDTPT
jgi:hypothetical protein